MPADPRYIPKPFFPVTGARKDKNGNLYPVELTEHHVIINSCIKLREVPYCDYPITIPGFTEVLNMNDILPGTFCVNYITGRIYFHDSMNGTEVTVNYKGIGSLVATDEINYLYYLITKKLNFSTLFDTPDNYSGHALKYVRVNKNENGLVFDFIETGRNYGKTLIFQLNAGETKRFDIGTEYDIVQCFRKYNGTQQDEQLILATNCQDSEAGAIVVNADGDFELDLSVVQTDKYYCRICEDFVDTTDWDEINDIFVSDEVDYSKGDVRYFIIADNEFYGWNGSRFGKIDTSTRPLEDVAQTFGMTSLELNTLHSSYFNEFVGKKISIAVCLLTKDINYTPKFINDTHILGISDRYIKVDSEITAYFFKGRGQWQFTNEGTENKDVVVYFGSGKEDIQSSSDLFIFNDVPPGEPIYIRSLRQTLVDVYAEDIVVYEPAYDNDYDLDLRIESDQTIMFTEYIDNLLLEFDECKDLQSAGFPVIKLWDFRNGNIGDLITAPDNPTYRGTYYFVCGKLGSAMIYSNYSLYGAFKTPAISTSISSALNCGIIFRTFFEHPTDMLSWINPLKLINLNYSGSCSRSVDWPTQHPTVSFELVRKYASSPSSNKIVRLSGFDYSVSQYCTNLEYLTSEQFPATEFSGYAKISPMLIGNIHSVVSAQHIYANKLFSGSPALDSSCLREIIDNCYKMCLYGTNGYAQYEFLAGWMKNNSAIEIDLAWVCGQYEPYTGAGIGLGQYEARLPREIHSFIKDRYNTLVSYYNSVFPDGYIRAVSREFNLSSPPYEIDVAGDFEFYENYRQTFNIPNPNKYIIGINDHYYRWNTSTQTFEEVSLSSPDSTLYSAGNTAEEISNIPPDAWASMNITKFELIIIAYLGWFYNPYFKKITHLKGDEVLENGWRLLNKENDISIYWMENRRLWKIVHHFSEPKKIKVVVSGLDLNVGYVNSAEYFTDLLDTPVSLNYATPQVLIAKDNLVTLIPYINPLMYMKP